MYADHRRLSRSHGNSLRRHRLLLSFILGGVGSGGGGRSKESISFILVDESGLAVENHTKYNCANKFVYAPEPIDVRRLLETDIISSAGKFSVMTSGPIGQATELGNYVETITKKQNADFNVSHLMSKQYFNFSLLICQQHNAPMPVYYFTTDKK